MFCSHVCQNFPGISCHPSQAHIAVAMAQNMAVYYQITNDRVQYVTISPSDHICQLVHAVWKMHYELSKTGMAVYQCNQHFKESKQALCSGDLISEIPEPHGKDYMHPLYIHYVPPGSVLLAVPATAAAAASTYIQVPVAPPQPTTLVGMFMRVRNQFNQGEKVQCKVSLSTTESGIKSRLADHVGAFYPGAVGGYVRRVHDLTKIMIESELDNVKGVLGFVDNEKSQCVEFTVNRLSFTRDPGKSFHIFRSTPAPQNSSSGDVGEEGRSASSVSDARTPSRLGSDS